MTHKGHAGSDRHILTGGRVNPKQPINPHGPDRVKFLSVLGRRPLPRWWGWARRPASGNVECAKPRDDARGLWGLGRRGERAWRRRRTIWARAARLPWEFSRRVGSDARVRRDGAPSASDEMGAGREPRRRRVRSTLFAKWFGGFVRGGDHDVSIRNASAWRGAAPRSKRSTTIMRPPQHGHGAA